MLLCPIYHGYVLLLLKVGVCGGLADLRVLMYRQGHVGADSLEYALVPSFCNHAHKQPDKS